MSTLAPLVLTLEDGTVLYLDEDGNILDELMTLGGTGSGNHGHAGRKGKVGGSSSSSGADATAVNRTAFNDLIRSAGLKVAEPSSLTPEMMGDPNYEPVATPLTQAHLDEANTVLDAIEEIGGTPHLDHLREQIKRHLEVAAAPHDPPDAVMTTITGKGRVILLINTRSDVGHTLSDSGSDEGYAYAAQEGRIALRATGDRAAAIQKMMRLVALHEIGHVYDAATGGALTDTFGQAVQKAVPDAFEYDMGGIVGTPKLLAWLRTNVSGYSQASAQEASADAFSILMGGYKSLPPDLKEWGEHVRAGS